jgi:hypothetical protein
LGFALRQAGQLFGFVKAIATGEEADWGKKVIPLGFEALSSDVENYFLLSTFYFHYSLVTIRILPFRTKVGEEDGRVIVIIESCSIVSCSSALES